MRVRYVSLMTVVIILLSVFPATTYTNEPEILLFEDWEEYKIGGKPGNPWKTEPEIPLIEVVSVEGDKFIKIDGSDELIWNPPSQIIKGEFNLSFDVDFGYESNSYLTVLDNLNQTGINLNFYSNKEIWAYEGDDFWLCVATFPYENVHVEIVGTMNDNPNLNKYSIIVNDNMTLCSNYRIAEYNYETITHLENLSKFVFEHGSKDPIRFDNIIFQCIDCEYGEPIPDDDDDNDDDTHWEIETENETDDSEDSCCGC